MFNERNKRRFDLSLLFDQNRAVLKPFHEKETTPCPTPEISYQNEAGLEQVSIWNILET